MKPALGHLTGHIKSTLRSDSLNLIFYGLQILNKIVNVLCAQLFEILGSVRCFILFYFLCF